MDVKSTTGSVDQEQLVNKVIHGESISTMSKLEENTVDLVVADPPYNLSGYSDLEFDGTWKNEDGDEYNGVWQKVDEDWDDMSDEDYSQFSREWLSEVHRVLNPDGSLFLFGTYHHVNEVLSEAEQFNLLNEIIWFKRDAMPNITCSCVTASHENIYWMSPDNDKGNNFDYEMSKKMGLGTGRLNEEDKQLRSVWDIPKTKLGTEREAGHPTQKPLRVLDPIIRTWSDEEDIVLDPFCGSGSTLVASNINNRKYIGIDIDMEWIRTARNYISRVSEKPEKVREISEQTDNN